ncbi:signal recognition particle, SRP9/SRP14 subunit [Cunninghamella echinulata]|nr:signal recognition particle, SRP9/SRP14 subunit [Cunninghamella echinulata]
MYIKNWDDFQKAAEDIYVSSPDSTRYVHQFHGVDGELILKVTNDQSIVQYKTNQATDLKKFINLNTVLMSQMQNRSLEPENPSTEQPIVPAAIDSPQISETPTNTTTKSKGKKNKKKKGNK